MHHSFGAICVKNQLNMDNTRCICGLMVTWIVYVDIGDQIDNTTCLHAHYCVAPSATTVYGLLGVMYEVRANVDVLMSIFNIDFVFRIKSTHSADHEL